MVNVNWSVFYFHFCFLNGNSFHRERQLTHQMSPSPKQPCIPASGPLRWRSLQAFCSSSQIWTRHSRLPELRYCSMWLGKGLLWLPWERWCLSLINKYVYIATKPMSSETDFLLWTLQTKICDTLGVWSRHHGNRHFWLCLMYNKHLPSPWALQKSNHWFISISCSLSLQM